MTILISVYLCVCVYAWEAGSESWSTFHKYHICTGAHQCVFAYGSENRKQTMTPTYFLNVTYLQLLFILVQQNEMVSLWKPGYDWHLHNLG